ncbi:MAG: M23 family metallopeptidase [Chlorobiaceae bacterium]|nr:M23 family metallopeptidase [Chlorobiaceae bacterium]
MLFFKPPYFNILQRFQRPTRHLPATALLIVALLAALAALGITDKDEFGLAGPAVPARIIGGEHESVRRVATLAGTISTTFSGEMSMKNRGELAEKVKRLLASKVNLDGASTKGASYRILYEEQLNGHEAVSTGDILSVEVGTGKQRFNAYRFRDAEGGISYYDERGLAVTNRPLLQQPCIYRRVSSEFGYRRHPISRMMHFHGGVDFAAPTGTPVRAVADGNVTFSGRNGGAGNMVTLAHGGRMHTQYLHLSRFAPAFAYGSRVRQGDIIGYVGSTGSSTGPHLDFRVIVDGILKDPLVALRTPAPKRSLTMPELAGLLAKIDLYKAEVDNSLFRVAGISGHPTVSL